MAQFTQLRSRMVLLPVDDVDTDQIIPARFLKVTDKAGLGAQLFADWRYFPDGTPRPDFALNRPESAGAEVLLAGRNFGCGSSREHAPWALAGWGIRAVIALGFADIFRGNALKNGIVPLVVDEATHAGLVAARQADAALEVEIDLARTELGLPDGRRVGFPVDPFARHCLVHGVDELGYLLAVAGEVAAYEARHGK
jgi:3-isopropylmalate/(R)-2-methylmalate dehydratase small subunit